MLGSLRRRRYWIDTRVPGWMTAAELKLIARTAANVRPGGVIVEIGSFAGRSSVHWAANSDPTVAIYCIDPFDLLVDDYSLAHIQGDATGVANRPSGDLFAEHTMAWSHRLTALAELSPPASWDRRADLVFIDGDHTTEGVTRDLRFWSEWLESDGFLLGHDWDDQRVRAAVEAFAAERELSVHVHAGTNIWQL